MNDLHRHDYRGIHWEACQSLRPRQLAQLHSALNQRPARAQGVLAGRQSVAIVEVEDIGSVAVKQFARGGMVRRFNRDLYLHWPRSRCEREFRWLKTVRRVGVAAPRPIAFAFRGRVIGQCWLIMDALDRHRSLIQAAQHEDLDAAVVEKVAGQIKILISHRIWHRDLHPGNVLLDQKGKPRIIDFDKARCVNNRQLLKNRYRKRWNRAIVKHHLPGELARIMTLAAADP
jgi:RIO-like serine/threonine protein kinase